MVHGFARVAIDLVELRIPSTPSSTMIRSNSQPGWRAISKENAAAGTNEDSPSFRLGPQFLQVLPAS